MLLALFACFAVDNAGARLETARSQGTPIEVARDELLELIRASCVTFELAFPIANIPRDESSSAILEHVLERALASYTTADTHVGFRGTNLVIRITRTPISSFGQNPDLIQRAQAATAEEEQRIGRLNAVIGSVLAATFVSPPTASVEVRGQPGSNLGAIQALGSLTTNEVASLPGGKIDLAATWSRVISAVRGAGFSIDREAPIDQATGRRTLRTVPIPSKDDAWLYQRFHEIAMWDPAVAERRLPSQGLRISVNLVVGRRKQLNPEFEYLTRSGPAQEELLDAILRAILKP